MAPTKRIEGTVLEVGWENNTANTVRVYAIIKVKLVSTRRKDLAEEHLKRMQKRILGKKVRLIPED